MIQGLVKDMTKAANDSHSGTLAETLTQYVYPEIIPNKDSIQVCKNCKQAYPDFVKFLIHLTKRYDSRLGKDIWSCPINSDYLPSIYAQNLTLFI